MENNEDNDEPVRDSTREPTRDSTSNSHNEDAQQGTLLEKEEEEEQKENEEATEAEEEGQGKSEGPTEAEKEWIKKNPFECEIEGCEGGKFGRPYRSKKTGGMNLHKWNTHGIKAGDKEKKKTEPKGEVDMVNEAIKRKEAAELKGKLTQTINRIIKLGTKQKEVLEPENSILKEWKRRCLQKECAEEEIAFMQDELSSIVLTIDELEKESKEEKQKKVTKETKKEEDDDDDDLLGYGDMKTELKMMKIRRSLDEERKDREAARRREDQEEKRREEDHQKRMQMMGGGGHFGGMDGTNPMGMVYERIVTFKHDEDGNVLIGENGQPIPESMREIPVNPNALVQSRGRGGDGGDNLLKTLETYHKLTKGDEETRKEEIKELKEDRRLLIDKLDKMSDDKRDGQLWGAMSEFKKGMDEIKVKIEEDPMDAYITMQDRLKDHNITLDGSTSPEVRKIDLEIEREKTRRSTDMMMMNKTFKMAETAIKQVSDGPMAKAFARKIDQSDVIAEEEDMPGDEEIEQEMEEEVAPPRQPAEEVPKLPPKKKRRGRNAKKKPGQS